MKYQSVVSPSSRQFDEMIQKEMERVIEKRQDLYQILYHSIKHKMENTNVIRMKQL